MVEITTREPELPKAEPAAVSAFLQSQDTVLMGEGLLLRQEQRRVSEMQRMTEPAPKNLLQT